MATVGPSVNSYEKINALLEAGVNGFRLNFSHGDYDERRQQIAWIREASHVHGRPVAILQDLQGPKIRLGKLKGDSLRVARGDELVLAYGIEHVGRTLPVQFNLAEKVKAGEPLYLFDGKIKAEIKEVLSDNSIRIEIKNGGVLASNKGINLPETDFDGDVITPKDIRDLEFGASQDIDYVAMSFVQSTEDISSLRQLMLSLGSDAHLIAKIETKAALREGVLESIITESDGIMVARGDLAVEAGAEVVPVMQRRIINLCRKESKLSIVATQMMASMVDSPEPTRAEASDVANAVIQGADCVMLSDETANGAYPIETVQAMKKVILYTQDNWGVEPLTDDVRSKSPTQDAISAAAVQLADHLKVDAIVAETKSGATAASICAHRPGLPILSVTSSPRAAQQLALSYANRSFVRPDGDKAGLELARDLHGQNFFGPGRTNLVIVSGRQPGVVGATDTIRVRVLE